VCVCVCASVEIIEKKRNYSGSEKPLSRGIEVGDSRLW